MPVAAAIAQPNALAEARAIPEALAMLGKSKGSSNPNPGRVILRKRDKPKPPCKKCKRSKKGKKSKKKCIKCMGIYPIPYPGKLNHKDDDLIENRHLQEFSNWFRFCFCFRFELIIDQEVKIRRRRPLPQLQAPPAHKTNATTTTTTTEKPKPGIFIIIQCCAIGLFSCIQFYLFSSLEKWTIHRFLCALQVYESKS